MPASLGKYYDQVALGRVFIGSNAVGGTAFPISTGTAVTVGLWNASQSKNAVLLGLNIGFTSGTIALGEIGIANQNVGYNIATGAAMTAFNDSPSSIKNALLGGGDQTAMNFSAAATTTLTAGGTACWWSGKSIESATPGLGIFSANIDIDGVVIVAPGQIAFVCGSVAQTGLFTMSLIWAEVDN